VHNRTIKYSEEFKRLAVAKYLSRGNRGVAEVLSDLGIASSMLYTWINRYCNEDLTMKPVTRSPSSLSPQEKLKLVLEFEVLDEGSRGEFLRSNGVTSEQITQWKQSMSEGLSDQEASDSELKTKVKRLEKELARKDKALSEAAALLLLQKKIQGLFNSEDES
jgi:transposase-like protein